MPFTVTFSGNTIVLIYSPVPIWISPISLLPTTVSIALRISEILFTTLGYNGFLSEVALLDKCEQIHSY